MGEGQNKRAKRLRQFTDEAQARWDSLGQGIHAKILGNVWCGRCMGETTIVDVKGSMENRDLILRGRCAKCGGAVARVVEGEDIA